MDCGENSSANGDSIDWSKCFICQEFKSDSLLDPENIKANQERDGLKTLAQKIKNFEVINEIPNNFVRVKGLNEKCLKDNHAKYHRKCSLNFNQRNLEFAQRRALRKEKKRPINWEGNSESPKTRSKVIKISTECTNPSGANDQTICFFYGHVSKCPGIVNETSADYRRASTSKINDTIKDYAKSLNDSDLLAKLAFGDMHCHDAIYHASCHTALRNESNKSKKKKQAELNAKEQSLDYLNQNAESIALSEIVIKIEEEGNFSDKGYLLSELFEDFRVKVKSLVNRDPACNRTKFKIRLMQMTPLTEELNKANKIVLSYQKGTFKTKTLDDKKDDDSLLLMKAARLCRNENFLSSEPMFQGNTCEQVIRSSPSANLQQLISYILQGESLNNSRDMIIQSFCQLLKFNSVKRIKKQQSSNMRHNQDKETPIAVFIGLSLYKYTNSRDLIETFHDLGLCINYRRVMQIYHNIHDQVVTKYQENKLVYPTSLPRNHFTTIQFDNINKQGKSTFASDLSDFNGTGISVAIQYDTNKDIIVNDDLPTITKDSKKVKTLPENYKNVEPAFLKDKYPKVPKKEEFNYKLSDEQILNNTRKEDVWLGSTETNTWAGFHSSLIKENGTTKVKCKSQMLPLHRENAHTPAMVKHCLKQSISITNFMNPGQIPVNFCDQPLYAISKQLQWQHEDLNENKVIVMLGGLHIEMAIQSMIGHVLKGSGWTEMLADSNLTTEGRADAMTGSGHVKRTRYGHQVTLKVLHNLKKNAYDQDSLENDVPFEEWETQCINEYPQFFFWDLIMKLEKLYLAFISSLRERNFDQYISCLIAICVWMEAFDRRNYKRWLPVHICDMINLKNDHPKIYKEFKAGKFVGQVSEREFSAMSLDQIHEHLNKDIKEVYGIFRDTTNQDLFNVLQVAGPEVCRILTDIRQVIQHDHDTVSTLHREDSDHERIRFNNDVQALQDLFEDNPFLDRSSDFIQIHSGAVMRKEIIKSLRDAEKLGKQQYFKTMEDVFINGNLSIMNVLHDNKVLTFSSNIKKKISKAKVQKDLDKRNTNLFAQLFLSNTSLDEDTDREEFLSHENDEDPPSIAFGRKMRTGTKADILPCITNETSIAVEFPENVTYECLDGAVIVHFIKGKKGTPFIDYAKNQFIPFIVKRLKRIMRLDIIFDQYFENSIKSLTRENRASYGSSVRIKDIGKRIIPKDWAAFLRNEKNKEELFSLLAEEISKIVVEGKTILVTSKEKVEKTDDTDVDTLQPCKIEEFDSRFPLHLYHASQNGHKNLLVKTVDTDIIIIAIARFKEIGCETLYVEYGKTDKLKIYAIHDIVRELKEDIVDALPFFYALTGCDTVSFFHRIGKKTAWNIWKVMPEITEVFKECWKVDCMEVDHRIERFIILLYSKTSDITDIHQARFRLLTSGRFIDYIPPTRGALLQHIKRATLQTKLWMLRLIKNPEIPNPINYGWILTEDKNSFIPKWSDLPVVSEVLRQLIKCKCKKKCSGNCKCNTLDLKCTPLCACFGNCYGN